MMSAVIPSARYSCSGSLSPILAALREKIGGEAHIAISDQCSPHHVNDAFYPIANQIWQTAGFASGEMAAARRGKLEAMFERSGLESKELAPFLAALLSIPVEGRYPALEMSPSEQKERTIAALIALFVGLTKDAPGAHGRPGSLAAAPRESEMRAI